MPATEKLGKDYLRGRQDARKLDRVLDHLVDRKEDEAHRAALVAQYADTLQAGLTVLGIVAPNRL